MSDANTVNTIVAIAIVASAFGFPTYALAAPVGAEFAVRWNSSDGGPARATDALAALGAATEDSAQFRIQYFSISNPPSAPSGFTVIARSRQGPKKTELTIKLRGNDPAPNLPSLASWDCGLATAEKKDEVDVTIMAGGEIKRAFSRSCTMESKKAAFFPPMLGATAKGCEALMTRLKVGSIKVEEWVIKPSGARLIEVSRNAPDTKESLDAFNKEVVASLLTQGIRPLDRSKSEVGGECR